ncbi:serine protease [Streptomyces spongiicola]|uniref:Serine protease n=1 Tax=Streptomyces spongiicola TaxID=1690221 RepID=A0A388SRI2_9ACTN|nr:trypsin-like peptidase domain-containing protein [Streptomyces spongiicola]GBP99242.1 serine protease [Streptomyces spongiicola]
MGWFFGGAAMGPDDAGRLVVAVRRVGGSVTAGAGVLLSPGVVLTCAHVVNDALGRAVFAAAPPGRVALRIDYRDRHGTREATGELTHWIPPRRLDGTLPVREREDRVWHGDLAVLTFPRPPEGRMPQTRWAPMRPGQSLRAWSSSGRPGSFADVRVKTCDKSVGYVDGEPTGMSIGPAFSGGALWSVPGDAAVGLVAAHTMPPADPVTGRLLPHSSQHVARRSWAIPWQRIRRELASVGAVGLVDDEPPPDDPAFALFAETIHGIVPSTDLRGDLGRLVAGRCALRHPDDGSAPSPEEFARLLVTEPRALPALTEILRLRDPSAVRQLLAIGRMSPVPRLLSPREYGRLTEILGQLPGSVSARLPVAARAALPLAADYPVEPSGPAAAADVIDRLERLPGDSRSQGVSPRVPGLLRVMEYLAALCSEDRRAGLRLWCDGVAQRLGIPQSALAERRFDADEWAGALAACSGPPRVLVHITRGVLPDRYRLRIWCDEGTGPRQVTTESDRDHTGGEAARLLLHVLESFHRLSPEERRPLVEAVVDRSGLNLPIDEWETWSPDDVVPGVLGAEYPLVVNCPELLRRNERFLPEWRRRWRQLDTGASLRFSGATVGPRQIYGTLMDHQDAVRVAVDAAEHLRDGIVEVCLAVGVPVVVWDRGDESHAVDHIATVTTRELPEGVRSYRAKTVHRPSEYPGRPVLAWADADRPVPQLHLSEPQES